MEKDDLKTSFVIFKTPSPDTNILFIEFSNKKLFDFMSSQEGMERLSSAIKLIYTTDEKFYSPYLLDAITLHDLHLQVHDTVEVTLFNKPFVILDKQHYLFERISIAKKAFRAARKKQLLKKKPYYKKFKDYKNDLNEH